ncbi:hypothetical protein Hte_007072 [Hypoxylon texense]
MSTRKDLNAMIEVAEREGKRFQKQKQDLEDKLPNESNHAKIMELTESIKDRDWEYEVRQKRISNFEKSLKELDEEEDPEEKREEEGKEEEGKEEEGKKEEEEGEWKTESEDESVK